MLGVSEERSREIAAALSNARTFKKALELLDGFGLEWGYDYMDCVDESDDRPDEKTVFCSLFSNISFSFIKTGRGESVGYRLWMNLGSVDKTNRLKSKQYSIKFSDCKTGNELEVYLKAKTTFAKFDTMAARDYMKCFAGYR